MKRCVAILVVLWSTAARADSFEEYADTRPAEATNLVERSCDLALALRGAVVTGELRQRIANTGPLPLAAAIELAIPAGAVITGLATQDGAALAVPAGFRSDQVTPQDVLGADPALLTMIGPEAYRLTLQPIERGRDVTVTTRWTAVAEVADGGLRVELPGRAATGLGECHGTLKVSPGPGTTVAAIRLDGREVRARDNLVFGLAAQPLAIEVDLAFAAKRDPVVWTQSESVGDGWQATLATVIAPPARATAIGAHRALFVIDGSRSMELVGKPNVIRVMRAIAAALPSETELEAIVYDRVSARVLGGWQTQTPETVAALEHAITAHPAGNGSDLAGAFALAHTLVADGARSQTIVVVITDGVLGSQVADTALVDALAATTSTVDVHAVVIDPAKTRSPNVAALQRPVSLYGGSLVEVAAADLDHALVGIEGWLRPAWLDVALAGIAIPTQLRAGSGGTYAVLAHDGKLVLTGNGLHVAARPAPTAPIAALVLAGAPRGDLSEPTRLRAEHEHPYATHARAFAVLTANGKVAADRHAMVKGGGPYTRLVALDDVAALVATSPAPPIVASAISKDTLERLFRDQLQPKAFACYQRALGLQPDLVGTAHFDFTIGRGEVTSVSLVGLGNAAFDACLLDAAYALTPPPPDFAINTDDESIATYPLTFNKRDDHPIIVLGDADSSSPLDIDAIEGGVPGKRRPIKVDATTPLGNMRPPKGP